MGRGKRRYRMASDKYGEGLTVETRERELRKELRELRAEMKASGVRHTSCFNGGLTAVEYRMNAERFRLETELSKFKKGV